MKHSLIKAEPGRCSRRALRSCPIGPRRALKYTGVTEELWARGVRGGFVGGSSAISSTASPSLRAQSSSSCSLSDAVVWGDLRATAFLSPLTCCHTCSGQCAGLLRRLSDRSFGHARLRGDGSPTHLRTFRSHQARFPGNRPSDVVTARHSAKISAMTRLYAALMLVQTPTLLRHGKVVKTRKQFSDQKRVGPEGRFLFLPYVSQMTRLYN